MSPFIFLTLTQITVLPTPYHAGAAVEMLSTSLLFTNEPSMAAPPPQAIVFGDRKELPDIVVTAGMPPSADIYVEVWKTAAVNPNLFPAIVSANLQPMGQIWETDGRRFRQNRSALLEGAFSSK